MTLQTDLAAFRATLVSFLNDKVKTTKLMTALGGELIGALPSSPQKNAVILGYNAVVTQFDVVTEDSNTLNALHSALTKVMAGDTQPIPISADGQAAFPPLGMLMDGNRVAWTFGKSRPGGGKDFVINRNGIVYPIYGMIMVMKDRVIWINDEANNWWTLDANQKPYTSISGPWGTLPQDLRSWNTKDGATMTASAAAAGKYGSSAFIVDMNGALWSFGAADGQDFTILRNGVPFSEPGFTTKPYAGVMIHLKNGIAYVQNAAASWVYPPI